MKASELTGAALDYMVAKCEGFEPFTDGISWIIDHAGTYQQLPRYSTDWAQGGPIIEREGINLFKHNKLSESQPDTWCAHKVVPRPNLEGSFNSCALALDGPTPLIAAMRCFVASRFGDEVDVPEELL